MSVLAPPRHDDPELLIREARARQRKRRLVGIAAALAACGLAIGAVVANTGRHAADRASSGSRGLAVPPRCQAGQLRLSGSPVWPAAAGSLLEQLSVTNRSRTPCSVAGWPAVRLLDAAGRPIRSRSFRYVTSETAGPLFRQVTLQPGGAAAFNYSAGDWNPVADRACPDARTVQIGLGGGEGWLSAPLKIPACGTLFIDPLVPGRTDPRWPAVGIQHFARP